MIVDLHSHTKMSRCGRDWPTRLCDRMVEAGVDVLGITDHHYGIEDFGYEAYRSMIAHLREEYRGVLTILYGIEVCTRPNHRLTRTDLSEYDYCLVEDLDGAESVMGGDILGYTASFGCPVGIAHTDLFGFAASRGYDPKEYFRALAERGVFWELNVNRDSTHAFHEHAYVKEFLASKEQQEIVRASGLCLSVGFDGHVSAEYDVERVRSMNAFLEIVGIPNAYPTLIGR